MAAVFAQQRHVSGLRVISRTRNARRAGTSTITAPSTAISGWLQLLLREIETKLLSLSPKQTTPFWGDDVGAGSAASSIIIARVAIVIDVVAVALLLLFLLLPLSCRIVTLNSLVLSVDKN